MLHEKLCGDETISNKSFMYSNPLLLIPYPLFLGFNVSISISYTPPDQYPDYSPPNYRAASSVQLNCVVSGSTGTVTYHWSSTCRDCFASNSRTSSISEDILTSRDAGIHTCTATDSLGNRASASIQMNIVGVLYNF